MTSKNMFLGQSQSGTLLLAYILQLIVGSQIVLPASSWRSGDDLNKIYDTATPNPTGSLSGPWIDGEGSPNVTGVKSKTAHLVCKVKNLGNQTVYWIRHSDTHLLTAGLYKYTPEERLSAIHRPSSEDWVLEIRSAQVSDSGLYECQISTTPVRNHVIHLQIAEPLIKVYGGPELHIKDGSRINISCEISGYPKKIGYLLWYKNSRSVSNKNDERYLISKNSSTDGSFFSTLIITKARSSDTGKYRCSSEAGDSEIVSVHVITGETRAGLQLNSAVSRFRRKSWISLNMFMTIFFLVLNICLYDNFSMMS